MKRMSACLTAASLVLALALPTAGAVYQDVPQGSVLAVEVQKAVDAGLMNGYSADRFGYQDSMTRIQFVTVLSRMDPRNQGARVDLLHIDSKAEQAMKIDLDALLKRNQEFFSALDAAVKHDIIDTTVPFRPDDPITRREMSEMLVRFLGLKSAAQLAEQQLRNPDGDEGMLTNPSMGQLDVFPFTDVTEGKGYIAIAHDIGMTKGTTATTFSPNATATRAQAAAMLVRIHEKLERDLGERHGFYAISSYQQLALAEKLDTVSAGWSRMTWDGRKAELSTTSVNGNEFCIPRGYEEVASRLQGKLYLNVFMDRSGGVAELLASPEGRTQAVNQIVNELTISYQNLGRNPYSGVTIDFEGLRSTEKKNFTTFLQELSESVKQLDRNLYVCVSPVLTTGSYYDGYDYADISALADKVILMAYDYDTQDMSQFVGTEYYKTAAPAPMDQIYWSLRDALCQMDHSKVLLGFSSKNTAWQIDENGKLLSGKPVHPSNETVAKRLAQSDTIRGWSDTYQQSYAIYTTEEGSRYFLWYQSDESIRVVANTAKLLGVSGVSLWRVGMIPQETIGGTNWNWAPILK